MKFTIQSKQLLSHLNAVSKVISNKNAYAILEYFLFELEGERLVITGSDMETRMTTFIEVPGAEGQGRFAIEVKRMLNLLREMPETGLTIDVNEENMEVNIKYLNGDFNAVALNGDEYPLKIQMNDTAHEVQLNQRDVADCIQRTVFAVGQDDMHPQFMGVFWDIKPESITFVASDAHKLVRYKRSSVKPGFEASFILPAKPATILASILDRDTEQPLTATIDETSATFDTGEYQLTCRFINGRYPNYEQVIPKDNPYTATLDRVTLLTALRRVSIFASVGGLVKLEFDAEGLKLTSQDLDHQTSAEEHVQCEYDGEPLTIGFKSVDLIDVLNNINCSTVVFKLLDPARAGIFLPTEQPEGEDLLILQMPMMIQQ
jgi:DNA polymerase-3 subunit beta